jgi:hypothetical protein
MRGYLYDQRQDAGTTRLIARIDAMSAEERCTFSKWLKARNGYGGGAHRLIPCFVFVDHDSEDHNVSDFKLNMSNGTAFVETRTALSAGQKIAILFRDSNNHGPVELMGKVIWIGSKVLGV